MGANYAYDIYDYGWGSKSAVGLDSSEFQAALLTDTTIQLGPPAVGAGVGFLVGGPPGAVIGGGVGSVGSGAWGLFGRDATVSFVDEHVVAPATKSMYMLKVIGSYYTLGPERTRQLFFD